MESSGAVTVGVAIITRDDLGPLKDLLAQVSGFDQVVVVDTGSRDGTRRYVKQLGPPYELHEFKWNMRFGSTAMTRLCPWSPGGDRRFPRQTPPRRSGGLRPGRPTPTCG